MHVYVMKIKKLYIKGTGKVNFQTDINVTSALLSLQVFKVYTAPS